MCPLAGRTGWLMPPPPGAWLTHLQQVHAAGIAEQAAMEAEVFDVFKASGAVVDGVGGEGERLGRAEFH